MPLDVALAFAARGCRVFPCIPRGTGRKRPLTPNGFHDASIDPAVIAGWWRRWPDALIGVSTGAAAGSSSSMSMSNTPIGTASIRSVTGS
jgi:hypothetical protein